MPPSTPNPEPMPLYDFPGWISRHPVVAIWMGAFCLWVSIVLMIRVWFVHRKAPFFKKLIWSMVLLFPLFGWLVYGGFFRPLDSINTPCPGEHDWTSSSGGGGGFDIGGGGHH
jgi:hypothetical protein